MPSPSDQPEHSGRLELTWTDKDRRLLSYEDGTFQWADPGDYRVNEVRLLHEVTTVGQTHLEPHRTKDNLLIRGDALHALSSLAKIPEFSAEYKGKVRLAYIDPPFNTGQAFAQYDDNLEHSIWLTMLRDRLEQIHDLLAPGGTVWLHLDDVEVHRARLVLDDIFPGGFITSFIWRKVDSPNDNKVPITPDHETILCYAKTPGAPSFTRKTDHSILNAYGNADDEGRRYRDRLLKKNGKNSLRADRPTMWYAIQAPDGTEVWPIHDDAREANWALGRASVKRLENEGELIWKRRRTKDGRARWVPYTREWAPADPVRPWPTIWTDLPTTRQAKAHLRLLFPKVDLFDTPKPEQLLERIVSMASTGGDIILDCFVGSGTTAAVAHKLGRRWVAVEWSRNTIETFTLPRLRKVVDGTDRGGISTSEELAPARELPGQTTTEDAVAAARLLAAWQADRSDIPEVSDDVLSLLQKAAKDLARTTRKVLSHWTGGGGFRVLDVGPSMFEEEDGQIFLASWAAGDRLAEAVAANYSFTFELDNPFCGRRGDERLAVIDGLVNDAVVDFLLDWLPEGQLLVVYGTGVDPYAQERLARQHRGSSLEKIPEALISSYRQVGRRSSGLTWASDFTQSPTVPA